MQIYNGDSGLATLQKRLLKAESIGFDGDKEYVLSRLKSNLIEITKVSEAAVNDFINTLDSVIKLDPNSKITSIDSDKIINAADNLENTEDKLKILNYMYLHSKSNIIGDYLGNKINGISAPLAYINSLPKVFQKLTGIDPSDFSNETKEQLISMGTNIGNTHNKLSAVFNSLMTGSIEEEKISNFKQSYQEVTKNLEKAIKESTENDALVKFLKGALALVQEEKHLLDNLINKTQLIDNKKYNLSEALDFNHRMMKNFDIKTSIKKDNIQTDIKIEALQSFIANALHYALMRERPGKETSIYNAKRKYGAPNEKLDLKISEENDNIVIKIKFTGTISQKEKDGDFVPSLMYKGQPKTIYDYSEDLKSLGGSYKIEGPLFENENTQADDCILTLEIPANQN